jgi:hypothetical protein
MCDYSLEGLPNRLAVRGERLATHRFRSGSIGMASEWDIAAATQPKLEQGESRGWWAAVKCWLSPQTEADNIPAVCIPPGARLRMSRIPDKMQRSQGLHPVEDVTFVQLSAEAFQYRDAIRFDNGRKVVLQTLAEGIPFEVVSLDVAEPEPEPIDGILVYPDAA